MQRSTIHNKFKNITIFSALSLEIKWKEILFVVPVGQEQEDAKTQEVIIAAHHWIQDQILEEDATSKIGQNQVNILTDMTEYSKTNVQMLTAGNSTIFQAHTNVWMQIIQ